MTETTTILFTDVEGSTNLRTRLGDEDANRVLAECERGVREAVEAHGGEVVKSLGDGIMACFTSARNAVMAGLTVQRGDDPDRPRVRVGINHGEVVRDGGDVQGTAVHAAARIAGSAAGGQVLISASVAELAGLLPESMRLVDRGLFWLKGFPDRWRLFEAVEGDEGAVATRSGSRTHYVGRDEELSDLRKGLEAADGGRGGIVLLGGEPGVGKTRLAEEIASLARRRGMLAFTGRCSDIEGAPPYLPFVEIFEAVAAFVPADALRAALGETGGDIARVVPSLRRVVPDLPPALDLPAEQERRYLLNAVRDFLARSARMHSLVLILDDLHWADEPTLRLVEHLAEVLPELPCLVIGTYRDVELDVGRPLARTLESLLRRHLATRVSLRRLPEHGVREMLASLAQQDPPDVLVKTVFSETEGNPFFVEEVFRHLAEEGRLFDDAGRFRTDLRIDEVDVPEGVRLVIGRRLERLGDDTREILAAGAVAGRIFPYRVLLEIAERPDADLLDALDEAERAHLVAPAGGGREERYAFSHELVRQTLLSGLTSARRRRLHLRAADAIEAVYGDDAAAYAADMAHHLTTAGAAADVVRTAHWLRLAGERALEATAFEDAVRHLEEALALEATDDERERADLRFLLGTAQRGAGRWEDALATWKESLTGFEALGDDDRLAEVAWHVGYQLLWAGRRDELVDMLARVLSRLEGADSVPHARLLFGAAAGFASAGQHEGTMLMLGKADRMVEALGDDAARRDLEQAHAFVEWTFPGIPASTRHGHRATELMREAGALWDLANVESFVAASEALSGNDDEARAAGQRASELAGRLGHIGAHIYVSRALSPLEVQRTARLDEFVAEMEREAELAREAGISWGEANAWWYAEIGQLWRGRWDEAHRLADTGIPADLPAAFVGWGQGVRALVMAHVAPDEALDVIEGYRGEVVIPGRVGTSGAWMVSLFTIEALAMLGEWDRVGELAPILEGLEATGIVRRVIDYRSTDAIRGMVAAALGDATETVTRFEAALAHADERGLRIESAEARRLFAIALERLGTDAERVAALRAEAASRYREIGMERFATLCGD